MKYITSALDVLFDEFDPTPYVSDPDDSEVTVRQLNKINIKHVETDIKISFEEIDFSIDTEEEFQKSYKNWFYKNYIKLLMF